MAFLEKLIQKIEKLQELPEWLKKVILFSIGGMVALAIGFLGIRSIEGGLHRLSSPVQFLETAQFPLDEITNPIKEVGSLLEQIKLPELPAAAESGAAENVPAILAEQDTTDTWKLYQSTIHGFSISYPPSYTPEEVPSVSNDSAFLVTFSNPKLKSSLPAALIPILKIKSLATPLSAEEFVKTNFSLDDNQPQKVLINEQEALQFDLQVTSGETTTINFYTMFKSGENTLFSLEYRYAINKENPEPISREAYDTFLRTFKLNPSKETTL